jgi:hypothetical protein
VKPLVFCYMRLPVIGAAPPARPDDPRPSLGQFAARKGFTIAQVFIDADRPHSWPAFESLLEAARFTDIAAVVVPDWTNLGAVAADRDARHRRIIELTGVPVLAAAPAAAAPRPA